MSIVRTPQSGMRDGSAVKGTDSSSRGIGFKSQHPHGSSQLSITPGPGIHGTRDAHGADIDACR